MNQNDVEHHSFLKISNSPFFSKFLHDYCDELIKESPVELKNFYYNDDIEWTAEDIEKTKILIQEYFRKCIIHDKFEKLEFISDAAFDTIIQCFETRRDELQSHLVKSVFLEAEHNILENIDYKLKWILGNSMLSGYKEPILQLQLGYCQKNVVDLKPERNIIDVEMEIEQVDEFISVLKDSLKELKSKNSL